MNDPQDQTVDEVPDLESENLEEVSDTESPTSSDLESEQDDTFSREYVEKLRQENGKYRQRAQRADDLAHRLHRALVAADGRLQDPTDLDFSDDHLTEDGVSLTEAIDDLLKRKPHLAARRPIGDVGQGATTTPGEVNLLGILGGR
ncbi:hypothetical protein [Gordonia phthalatica]|uniref:Uncharacterized protein n=1 Tax=Gordonia phthalatica TaxID=1136941 RepID=A0A0N9NDP8_9ACTN|nr:hypothetical protein [Gordonia phthalatica]ALG85842.1 hypothetical protein ACH46_16795 [Gordonia phthalatica]